MSQIEEVRKLVQEELVKLQRESVPHICAYCQYFQLSEAPPTNRYCQFKGMLQVDKGRCISFQLTDDWNNRRNGDITV
jgi:hypothetical protein